MIRVDEKTSAAGLKIDVRERRKPEPIERLQDVQNTVLLAVATQFVVQMEEQLRRHPLDLKTGLVVDSRRGLVFFRPFAADPMGEELVKFREFTSMVGENFGYFRRSEIPGDDVARPGDVQ